MKKYSRLIVLLLVIAMTFTLAGCKSAAAKKTEALISSIGEVTADSKDAVEAAEAAYAALSDKDRANVENAADLTAAREALDSALRVKGVEDLIEGLGAITVDSQAAVEAAEDALRALPAAEAALVENAASLADARVQLDEAILEAARRAVLGRWQAEADMTTSFISGFLIGVGEMGQYLPRPAEEYFSSVIIPMDLELKDDGTFTLVPVAGWSDRMVDDLAPGLLDLMQDLLINYLPVVLSQSGVNVSFSSPEELDSWLRANLGEGLDSLIESSLGMDLVSFLKELLSEADLEKDAGTNGKFEIRPAEGKILFAVDNAELSESVFDLYELSGDTLTLRAGSGDVLTFYVSYGNAESSGLPAELVFTRAA